MQSKLRPSALAVRVTFTSYGSCVSTPIVSTIVHGFILKCKEIYVRNSFARANSRKVRQEIFFSFRLSNLSRAIFHNFSLIRSRSVVVRAASPGASTRDKIVANFHCMLDIAATYDGSSREYIAYICSGSVFRCGRELITISSSPRTLLIATATKLYAFPGGSTIAHLV